MSRGSHSLGWPSWAVIGLLAAHDLTHVLDGGLETPLGQLAYVAIPQWLLVAVAMAVILRGDATRAGFAGLLLGASVAVGFTAVHLLPFAPTAFWDLSPSGISWVLAWASTVAGCVLAALAASAVRGRARSGAQ